MKKLSISIIISLAFLLTACKKDHIRLATVVYKASSANEYSTSDGTLLIRAKNVIMYKDNKCAGPGVDLNQPKDPNHWWDTNASLNNNIIKKLHINSGLYTHGLVKLKLNTADYHCAQEMLQYKTSKSNIVLKANHPVICENLKYNSTMKRFEPCNLKYPVITLEKP